MGLFKILHTLKILLVIRVIDAHRRELAELKGEHIFNGGDFDAQNLKDVEIIKIEKMHVTAQENSNMGE